MWQLTGHVAVLQGGLLPAVTSHAQFKMQRADGNAMLGCPRGGAQFLVTLLSS